MAKLKDRYSLDIHVPKSRAGKSKKGKGKAKSKVKMRVPKGYKATQKPGRYKKTKGRAGKRKKKLFAKNGAPSLYSRIYESHKQRLIDIATKFLKEELGVVVEWLRDITNVRRKINKVLNYHAILTAGVVLILIGVAAYLECICPQLMCGMALLVVGLAAIIIALVYKRYS